ncbi:hypothetical protein SRHO_G00118460 [Serrasalmus rhombeus]
MKMLRFSTTKVFLDEPLLKQSNIHTLSRPQLLQTGMPRLRVSISPGHHLPEVTLFYLALRAKRPFSVFTATTYPSNDTGLQRRVHEHCQGHPERSPQRAHVTPIHDDPGRWTHVDGAFLFEAGVVG